MHFLLKFHIFHRFYHKNYNFKTQITFWRDTKNPILCNVKLHMRLESTKWFSSYLTRLLYIIFHSKSLLCPAAKLYVGTNSTTLYVSVRANKRLSHLPATLSGLSHSFFGSLYLPPSDSTKTIKIVAVCFQNRSRKGSEWGGNFTFSSTQPVFIVFNFLSIHYYCPAKPSQKPAFAPC